MMRTVLLLLLWAWAGLVAAGDALSAAVSRAWQPARLSVQEIPGGFAEVAPPQDGTGLRRFLFTPPVAGLALDQREQDGGIRETLRLKGRPVPCAARPEVWSELLPASARVYRLQSGQGRWLAVVSGGAGLLQSGAHAGDSFIRLVDLRRRPARAWCLHSRGYLGVESLGMLPGKGGLAFAQVHPVGPQRFEVRYYLLSPREMTRAYAERGEAPDAVVEEGASAEGAPGQ